MATYKLIQDIEAEDHILGPLSLRQFIFALIAVFFGYLSFIAISKHFAFMLVVFLPPGLFCLFFALPWGRDQPTETWALAKARFWFLPRSRAWNQSGVKEMVTITVPKKVVPVLTDGLSQTEVKSRLKALATTLDSRGWAVKNVGPYTPPVIGASTDRLVDFGYMPQEVPSDDFRASDDMMDAASSPIAQQFDNMIGQSSRNHRQELIDRLNTIREGQAPAQPGAGTDAGWFTGPPAGTQNPGPAGQVSTVTPVQTAGPSPAPATNLRTMPQAPSATPANPAAQAAAVPPTPPVTPPRDPAILFLANRNDLNVSTLAREAKRSKGEDEEVVISLH